MRKAPIIELSSEDRQWLERSAASRISSVRLAERCRVVAEGAGGAALAAVMNGALAAKLDVRRVVCVVSGGNIDLDKLATILRGDIP